jgi:8-oxo-dGTP diphosphatase
MTHWPRVPYVGVGCLVVRGGQILLIRRHGLHGAGSWSPPGGHLDFGETPEGCAVREVLEEVGLHVSPVRFVAMTNDVFVEEDKHYITLWMRGDVDAGAEVSIQEPDEVAEIGWFDVTTLPSPLFLCFRNLVDGACLPALAVGEALASRSCPTCLAEAGRSLVVSMKARA